MLSKFKKYKINQHKISKKYAFKMINDADTSSFYVSSKRGASLGPYWINFEWIDWDKRNEWLMLREIENGLIRWTYTWFHNTLDK